MCNGHTVTPYTFLTIPLILSENASSLKYQDELMNKLVFAPMGLSFGPPENPFDCFNCTYNGEICHSDSQNITGQPYGALTVDYLPTVRPKSLALLLMINNL